MMRPVILFDSSQRLIEQARHYINDPGRILSNRQKAVPLLLKALKNGDLELRKEIVLVLGSIAKEEIYWPLYEIMKDETEPDEFRDQAAIHLAVIGPFLDDPQGLNRKLFTDIAAGNPDLKARAIMAVGWEGNLPAAVPLIECMYEPDPEIQELAVSALCNLKDSRLMGLLADRIKRCSFDQKRAILFNLWRFRDKQDEVAAIYKDELASENSVLRLDILILLGQIDSRPENESIYRTLLADKSPEVRALAIERLSELGCLQAKDIIPFLDDSSMKVKRTALMALQASRDSRT